MDTQRLIHGLQEARKHFTDMLSRTPADKLEWVPDTTAEGKPTSTLDIVRHCIATDVEMAGLIAGSATPEWSGDIEASFRSGPAAHVTDPDELGRVLQETAREADAGIEAVPDERWAETLELPWGNWSVEALGWLLVAHWYYHTGQIAYLQRCWGDVGM